MQNTDNRVNRQNPKLCFDLKGSYVNRKTKIEGKFWRDKLDQKKGLKDVNYLEINKDLNESLMNITKE